MSAMEKMMANILKDMLPPEVLAVANKENIEKIIGAAKETKDNLDTKLDLIISNQQVIQDELASQRAMLEELLNDLDGNSGNTGDGGGTAKRVGKPAASK